MGSSRFLFSQRNRHDRACANRPGAAYSDFKEQRPRILRVIPPECAMLFMLLRNYGVNGSSGRVRTERLRMVAGT
jgi:hypothetical protein